MVGRLTLDELVQQMAHGGADSNGMCDMFMSVYYLGVFTGPAPAIDRLGINPYQWGTECLSGDVTAGDATSFPMALGMVRIYFLVTLAIL